MSFVGTSITPSRILSLAETRSAQEIAATLRIDEEEVLEVLHRAGKVKATWTFRCNKTGRQWRARSERGAYRMAHLIGLTDWDCWQGEPQAAPGKRERMPAGPERDALVIQLRQSGATIQAIATAVGMSAPGLLKHLNRLTQ